VDCGGDSSDRDDFSVVLALRRSFEKLTRIFEVGNWQIADFFAFFFCQAAPCWIQQNTKDTHWIVHPDSLPVLVQMLCDAEPRLSGKNWSISYRSLFGAPLLANYLAAGWSSHLTIRDEPGAADHHLDFFGQLPRIAVEGAFLGAHEGIADLLVVDQMKFRPSCTPAIRNF